MRHCYVFLLKIVWYILNLHHLLEWHMNFDIVSILVFNEESVNGFDKKLRNSMQTCKYYILNW